MKTPLKRSISRENPVFILMGPSAPNAHWAPSDYTPDAEALVKSWNELDEDIRNHTTIQIEGICDDDWARNDFLLPYAEEAGIPVTIQVQTNNSDINDTVPLDRVRRYLDTYSCIVGVQIGEASVRTFVGHGAGPEYSMGRNARYARDLILLAGEYGVFMSWKLMSENYAAIASSVDNEALFETIRDHGEYVIPMHEMNCEFAKYIDHMSCMGFWLADITHQWGVQPQSWYWSDAGYAEPGCCLPGSLEMPGQMYAIMLMLGATAGATAYGMEPPWDIWTGPGSARFRDYVVPTLKRLLSDNLIPDKEEVLANTPLAYQLPSCKRPLDFHKVSDDLDFDHGKGRLIRATLGVYDRARDSEIIPNNPRYTWIPVLPARTDPLLLDRFKRVLHPGDVETEDDARKTAERFFDPVDRGTAWSTYVGPLTFAVNTHENWFVPEKVKLVVPRAPKNVRVETEGGVPTLTWDTAPGDKGYHIWRRNSREEKRLTKQPLTDTGIILDNAAPGDWFAVSAITSETETVRGTLHLHDFLILSSDESRCTGWVNKENRKDDTPRFGEGFAADSGDTRTKEDRCARCTPVEDLASPLPQENDPHRGVKQDVMIAMSAWRETIEAEDADGMAAFYAEDYTEPDGRTVESVRVAFKSILRKYLADALARQQKGWGVFTAWQSPVLRLFVRKWHSVTDTAAEVECAFELWAGGGPELEPSDMLKHPLGSEKKSIRMTWKRTGDGWRIAATDPPFLTMEDTMPFRFRYQGW